MSMFPDSYAAEPPPNLNEPLMPVETLAALLGLTVPLVPPLDAQVLFASEAVTRAIRAYCGRALSAGDYVEEFLGPAPVIRGLEAATSHIKVNLTEWPVASITEATVGGIPVDPATLVLHRSLGRLFVPLAGLQASPPSPLRVSYAGGFAPLPGDLAALYVDLCRRQLVTMGAPVSGGSAAPVKAVTVGALKIDYAINNVDAAGALTGGPMPLTADAMAAYEPILGQYQSVRMHAATIC